MNRLAMALRNIKGRFLLTVNDCDQTRTIFEGFSFLDLQIKYSLAKHSSGKVSGELLIANYPLERIKRLAA